MLARVSVNVSCQKSGVMEIVVACDEYTHLQPLRDMRTWRACLSYLPIRRAIDLDARQHTGQLAWIVREHLQGLPGPDTWLEALRCGSEPLLRYLHAYQVACPSSALQFAVDHASMECVQRMLALRHALLDEDGTRLVFAPITLDHVCLQGRADMVRYTMHHARPVEFRNAAATLASLVCDGRTDLAFLVAEQTGALTVDLLVQGVAAGQCSTVCSLLPLLRGGEEVLLLRSACERGATAVVQVLLCQRGVRPGREAFELSVRSGCIELVQLMLREHPGLEYHTVSDETVLHLCSQASHRILTALPDAVHTTQACLERAVCSACVHTILECLRRLHVGSPGFSTRLYRLAVRSGISDRDAILLLYNTRLHVVDQLTIDSIVHAGHTAVLRYLHGQGHAVFTPETLRLVCRLGQRHILECALATLESRGQVLDTGLHDSLCAQVRVSGTSRHNREWCLRRLRSHTRTAAGTARVDRASEAGALCETVG